MEKWQMCDENELKVVNGGDIGTTIVAIVVELFLAGFSAGLQAGLNRVNRMN